MTFLLDRIDISSPLNVRNARALFRVRRWAWVDIPVYGQHIPFTPQHAGEDDLVCARKQIYRVIRRRGDSSGRNERNSG
jgi:hypothetical protein